MLTTLSADYDLAWAYCIRIYILTHLGTSIRTVLAASPTLSIPVLGNSQFLLNSTLNGKMFSEVVYLLDSEK